jgi:hypothetical protein
MVLRGGIFYPQGRMLVCKIAYSTVVTKHAISKRRNALQIFLTGQMRTTSIFSLYSLYYGSTFFPHESIYVVLRNMRLQAVRGVIVVRRHCDPNALKQMIDATVGTFVIF